MVAPKIIRTCEYCGGFRPNKGLERRYCSKRCAVRARPTRDRAGRFWPKVIKADGCWLWTGGTYEFGYGCFFWGHDDVSKNGMRAAHRVAWELTNGPIPDGLKVLHRCDNPPCCNPDHLFLGTDADNSNDKVQKERHTRGVTNPHHKLTDDDVRIIRSEAASGVRQNALARRFGVAGPTISNIVNKHRWTHIE